MLSKFTGVNASRAADIKETLNYIKIAECVGGTTYPFTIIT